jgi:hypothetical protein
VNDRKAREAMMRRVRVSGRAEQAAGPAAATGD